MDKRQAPRIGGQNGPASGNRRRIAIQRNDIGTSLKNGRCIAASTECAIKDDLAPRGRQRRQHFGKQNRNVTNRSATGIRRTSAKIRHHSVPPSY